jgi:hypothetical protein
MIPDLALRYCIPQALRRVAPLFGSDWQELIVSAARACEICPSPENIEAARNAVHSAAHDSPIESPAYAAGHAAAYAAAVGYQLSMVLNDH